MMLWMHQMMSQWNQVVETTPWLLKTSDTVNVTEEIQRLSTRSQDATQRWKRLFSGFLVSFASGVVERNCWMKQQSNRHIQGHLQLSKVAVWVLCMGT